MTYQSVECGSVYKVVLRISILKEPGQSSMVSGRFESLRSGLNAGVEAWRPFGGREEARRSIFKVALEACAALLRDRRSGVKPGRRAFRGERGRSGLKGRAASLKARRRT
jgi:hypothetical protein